MGDQPQSASWRNVRVATLNVAGVNSVSPAVDALLDQRYDVLLLTETWQHHLSINIPSDYTLLSSAAESPISRGIHGVAILVRPELKHACEILPGGQPGRNAWIRLGDVILGVYYMPPSDDNDPGAWDPLWRADCPAIALGDANARLRELECWGTATRQFGKAGTRGKALQRVIDTNGGALLNRRLATPTPTNRTKNGMSAVDWAVANAQGAERVRTVNVGRAFVGTDHLPVEVVVSVAIPAPPVVKLRKAWNLDQLNETAATSAYADALRATLAQVAARARDIARADTDAPPATRQARADELAATLQIAIEAAADAALGRRAAVRSFRRNRKWWFTPGLKLLERRHKAMHRAWTKAPRHLRRFARQRMDEASKAFRRGTRTVRRDAWSSMIDKLEADDKGRGTGVMRWITRVERGRGRKANKAAAILDDIATHFSTTMNGAESLEHEPAYDAHDAPMPLKLRLELFSSRAVAAALTHTALHKAAGPDGIATELLRVPGSGVHSALAAVFLALAALRCTPRAWSEGLVCPLPKVANTRKPSEFRPIALLSVVRKVWERCVLAHLEATVGRHLSINQGGFRSSRSTMDQVHAVQMWVDQRVAAGAKPYMGFLDLKGAYDTVCRARLWRKLRKCGVDDAVANMLWQLFNETTLRVVADGQESAPFSCRAGVQQGSIVSPILFNAYIDDLVDYMNEAGVGCTFGPGNKRIAVLLYADDVVILARDAADLQRALNVADRWRIDNHMRFGVAKCGVVAPAGDAVFMLQGEPVPIVTSYGYLGVDMGIHGVDMERALERRVSKSKAAANRLAQTGMTKDGFYFRTRARLIAAVVRPTLEYGLATLKGDRATLKKLDDALLYAMRRALGVSGNTCANSLRHVFDFERYATRYVAAEAAALARHVTNAKDNELVVNVIAAQETMRGNASAYMRRARANPLFQRWLAIAADARPRRIPRAWLREARDADWVRVMAKGQHIVASRLPASTAMGAYTRHRGRHVLEKAIVLSLVDRVPVKTAICAVCKEPSHGRRHIMVCFRGWLLLWPWFQRLGKYGHADAVALALANAPDLDDPAFCMAARVVHATLRNNPSLIPQQQRRLTPKDPPAPLAGAPHSVPLRLPAPT